jgi:hypothetical protein
MFQGSSSWMRLMGMVWNGRQDGPQVKGRCSQFRAETFFYQFSLGFST